MEEKLKCVFLYEKGVPIAEIAAFFNRNPSTIHRLICSFRSIRDSKKSIKDYLSEYEKIDPEWIKEKVYQSLFGSDAITPLRENKKGPSL